MTTYTIKGQDFHYEDCCTCGVNFLYPAAIYNTTLERRGNGGHPFYCPNGHRLVRTGETEADKLRRERDRLKQNEARLEQEKADALAAAEAAQKALARHKKRSAAGTCPCCSRTFRQLAAHMKNKHPQWANEAGGKVVPLKAG